MAEPIFSTTMERLYDRLPEFYRTADEVYDWPLKRWLASVVDIHGEIDVLYDRINYIDPNDGGDPTDTSDLVDPTTADNAWLDWMAQLVGVTLKKGLSETERRNAIIYATTGWRSGTKAAVAAAAKTVLTGTQYAQVYDHSQVSGESMIAGGEWDVTVVTRTTETPDPSAVLDAIIKQGAKPVGVVLYHLAYAAAWSSLETNLPTWNDIEAVGSWVRIEEYGIS